MAEDVYRKDEDNKGQDTVQPATPQDSPKTETTTASGEKITVKIGKNYDSFNNTIADIENMAKYPERGHESFMINKRTHSAIAIRQNGQINMSASMYSQYKLNPSGKAVEQSLESVAITNRRKIKADDVVLNEHKLNPYLYELTDMKSLETAHNDHMLVGNFCLYGSVLVKAWEVNLHRYVFLRRPARIPMFSPLLNVPEIHAGLGVTDPLKIDETILAKSSKGYQVNKVYTDSASLIGKEGVDRAGINRNPQIAISGENAAIGSDGKVITSASNWNFSKVTSSSGKCKGGTGGGLGAKVIGTNGPLGNMSPDEVSMVKYVSVGLGVPMDWIYCQLAQESGLDSYNGVSPAARDYFNYSGIMNPGGESAGLKRYSSRQEWADDYIATIMEMYYAPDATQAKTAQDYYHCLQFQEHSGESFSYCATPPGDEYVNHIMGLARDRIGLEKLTKL